jgi:hypothetical protein
MNAKILNFQQQPFRWRMKTSPGKLGAFPNTSVELSELQAVTKDRLPLFDLSCSLPNGMGLIVADFDELPEGFESWDECRARLEEILSPDWCVTTSPSGKAKAFRLAQRADKQPWCQKSCHDFLDSHLPEAVVPFYDRKGAAFSFCFMNDKMFDKLATYLGAARPTQFNYSPTPIARPTPKLVTEQYENVEIPVPEWLESLVPADCPSRFEILEYLADNTGRLRSGTLEIVQSKVAALLEIDKGSFAAALKCLKAAGILVVTNAHYVPGKSGMKYGFGSSVDCSPKDLGERSGYREGLLIVSNLVRQGKDDDAIVEIMLDLEARRPASAQRRGENYWYGVIEYVHNNN